MHSIRKIMGILHDSSLRPVPTKNKEATCTKQLFGCRMAQRLTLAAIQLQKRRIHGPKWINRWILSQEMQLYFSYKGDGTTQVADPPKQMLSGSR